jgi:hypothetical protein
VSDVARLALDRIERSQRQFKLALAGAVMFEALLIGAMTVLVDFSDRVQALIFISAIGGYTLVAFGLVMVTLHVNRAVLRATQMPV